MSNQATLQGTTFTNVDSSSTTYGFRIYDDDGGTYNNILAKGEIADDLRLLALALDDGNETVSAILNHVMKHGKSLIINGELYSWEQIKHLWE